MGIPCRVAGISTTSSSSTSVPERRNESSHYEQRLEALQEQLAVINQTLAQITQSAAPGTTGLVSVPESSTHATLPFEGQSSFHHETLLAKDAALSAIATSHNSGLNDHVSAVLSSLKNSLAEEHLSNNGQPTETNLPSSSPDSKSLLPVDLVVAVVRAVKAKPPFFLVSHSWRDLLQVESLCQSIYFPINPVPAGSLTLLYGLLYYIIRDYLHEGHPDLARYDLASSARICERRFYLGLNSYELMADPTIEKIQALLIGVRDVSTTPNFR